MCNFEHCKNLKFVRTIQTRENVLLKGKDTALQLRCRNAEGLNLSKGPQQIDSVMQGMSNAPNPSKLTATQTSDTHIAL
jgi:hypothetical protein